MSSSELVIGVRTTNTTIAEGCFEIVAPARRIMLLELQIQASAATAQSLGIGRPAAAGNTPTANLFTKLDPADETADVSGVIAWGGAKPTAPAIFMRRCNFAATIGVGVFWTFRAAPIIIAASATFTIHNITAGAAVDVNANVAD